jgi:hypothetical protein
MAVWYSLWSFGIFFPFWYVCIKKNLATMYQTRQENKLCCTRRFGKLNKVSKPGGVAWWCRLCLEAYGS